MPRRNNRYNPQDYKQPKRKEKRRHANNGGSSKDKAENIVDKTLRDEQRYQVDAARRFQEDVAAGRASVRGPDGSWYTVAS